MPAEKTVVNTNEFEDLQGGQQVNFSNILFFVDILVPKVFTNLF